MTAAAGWDAVRRRLEREVDDLAEDEFLVVGEPAAPAGPPRGLLRRRPKPPATRYVQVRRDGDHLYAECIGAESYGGDWDVEPNTHQRIRGLGWLVPGEEDASGVQPSYRNYWRVLPRTDAALLTRACADALALLGADPASLEWTRDR